MQTFSRDNEPGRESSVSGPDRAGTGALARNGTIALESLAFGLAALAVMMVFCPADGGLRLPGPHLIWIAVLILAARYGTQGFLISLSFASAILLAVAVLRGDLQSLAARLDQAADLAGLLAAALVGWVASEHQRRRADLAARLGAARLRAKTDQSAMRELQSALLALRARADRLKFSLTFMRHAAARLENGDAVAAAQAALEISLARLGARAGVVQLFSGDLPNTLACVGPWTATGGGPADLRNDRAVAAALRARRGARAIDLVDAGPTDADLAAPLLDSHGQAFGVVATRGVPFAGASMATLKDLVVIASWLACALARAATITASSQGGSDHLGYAKADPLLLRPDPDTRLGEEPCSEDDLLVMPYLEMRLLADPFVQDHFLQSVHFDESR